MILIIHRGVDVSFYRSSMLTGRVVVAGFLQVHSGGGQRTGGLSQRWRGMCWLFPSGPWSVAIFLLSCGSARRCVETKGECRFPASPKELGVDFDLTRRIGGKKLLWDFNELVCST